MTNTGMPRIAAKKGPPGGRRASAAEVDRRLSRVEQLLRDGNDRASVVAIVGHEFGVGARTVDDYIARARSKWNRESAETRADDRLTALSRLDELSRKAEKRGAFGAAVAAERLRVDVQGLKAPEQIEAEVFSQPCPTCAALGMDREITVVDAVREVGQAAVALAKAIAFGLVQPTTNEQRAVYIEAADELVATLQRLAAEHSGSRG